MNGTFKYHIVIVTILSLQISPPLSIPHGHSRGVADRLTTP